MERLDDSDQKSLIDELHQGRELANQLQNEMGSISTREKCEELLRRILSSYDNALAVLLIRDPSLVVGLAESPETAFASSDDDRSNSRFKKHPSNKRKTMERWSEQVHVCKETGTEGPPDDGHSWRKYGQKDILGATYPRAYYRCSHRYSRGCLATKQVQRSDKNSSHLEVTYKGKHCCSRASGTLENQQDEGVNKRSREDQKQENDISPSFSFPSAKSVESENLGGEIYWEAGEENTFLSDCSDFTSLACGFRVLDSGRDRMTDYMCPGSEYEVADNSTPTSLQNSPFDLDLSIDHGDFDPHFSLDCQEWFS